jgi:hypothetical protein
VVRLRLRDPSSTYAVRLLILLPLHALLVFYIFFSNPFTHLTLLSSSLLPRWCLGASSLWGVFRMQQCRPSRFLWPPRY